MATQYVILPSGLLLPVVSVGVFFVTIHNGRKYLVMFNPDGMFNSDVMFSFNEKCTELWCNVPDGIDPVDELCRHVMSRTYNNICIDTNTVSHCNYIDIQQIHGIYRLYIVPINFEVSVSYLFDVEQLYNIWSDNIKRNQFDGFALIPTCITDIYDTTYSFSVRTTIALDNICSMCNVDENYRKILF